MNRVFPLLEGGLSLALGPLRAAETPQGRARDWSEGDKDKHRVEHRLRLHQGRAGSLLSVPAGDKLVLSRTGPLREVSSRWRLPLVAVSYSVTAVLPYPRPWGAPTRLPVSLRKERPSSNPWSGGRA